MTVTVEEAQADSAGLIRRLHPGEAVTLTDAGLPVAELSTKSSTSSRPRELGTLKGSVLHMAPDFNDSFVSVDEKFDDCGVHRIWN